MREIRTTIPPGRGTPPRLMDLGDALPPQIAQRREIVRVYGRNNQSALGKPPCMATNPDAENKDAVSGAECGQLFCCSEAAFSSSSDRYRCRLLPDACSGRTSVYGDRRNQEIVDYLQGT